MTPCVSFIFQGSKDPALHTLDCIFSVFVIGSLVVIVWRGSWGILDIILLPHDETNSAWLSLVSFPISHYLNSGVSPYNVKFACRRLSATE
jgi:Fuseless